MLGRVALALGATAGLAAMTLRPPQPGPALPEPAVRSHRLGVADRIPLASGEAYSVRTMLRTAPRMGYGSFYWDEAGVPPGPVLVRVDLDAQTLSIFRSGQEIGTAVILHGGDNKPSPTGTFPILEKSARHRSTLYDADMPFTLRLTMDGVAIHGSDVRYGKATHGCIGVPIAFARRLFDTVKAGDRVVIEA